MTTQEERQVAALVRAVAWLEDELRKTRSGVANFAQALEQSQAQIRDLTERLHRVEDTVSAILPQLPPIPHLDGQLAQLKDLVSGVHAHSLATAARITDFARQVDTAAERNRQVVNDLSHRIETVERQASGVGTRLDTLDEHARRSTEAITLARQRTDDVARSAEALQGRLGRLTETGSRTEQEQARLAAELDGLRKQDELLAERVQVFTEMIKRLDGQISLIAAEVAVKQDVIEKIDLNRVGVHRLEERISGTEAAAEQLRDHIGELEREVGLVEGRQKGFQDRLAGIHEDVIAQRTLVNDQIQRLYQLQERLKRRRIEDLERELREMRVHAFRAAEEQ